MHHAASPTLLLLLLPGVLQAIRSDNPIIFFEHVLLYNIKGETHEGDYCQCLERAEVGHNKELLGCMLASYCSSREGRTCERCCRSAQLI